jgi:hypothetical protein
MKCDMGKACSTNVYELMDGKLEEERLDNIEMDVGKLCVELLIAQSSLRIVFNGAIFGLHEMHGIC